MTLRMTREWDKPEIVLVYDDGDYVLVVWRGVDGTQGARGL